MTYAEQEILFAKVKHRFIGWSILWCNGYVAGVSAEDLRMTPAQEYVTEARENHTGYAIGYVAGFVAARGPDALFKSWAQGLLLPTHDFQWWTKNAD